MTEIPSNIQKLIDIYTKAQENLVKTIAEKEAKGNIATYQKSLLNQVMQILNDLDDEAKQWSQDVIPEYFRQGIDQAIQGLKNLGQDVSINTGFSQIHQGAIQAIVNSCYGDLNDANNFVGRRIQDTIRQAGIDAVANKIATGQTVQECKKNIVNSLINEGINGVKDKRGRNISLDAYASTVARTTTREATNTATKNQLTSLGYDLVKMSSHLTTCALCSMYQGRVYSISGQNSEYPPLDTAFSGDHANIHPNCRHVLMPYMPQLDDNVDSLLEYSNRPFEIAEKDKNAIDAYNKQQKEKRQLRDDRNQYQRYKLALPEDTPKTFANFRQMKYNNINKWDDLKGLYKYLQNYPDSDKTYYEITKDIQRLISEGKISETIGIAVKPQFVEFDTIHKHALKRMNKRNITEDDARDFINRAKVMFKQNGDAKNVYYSSEGSASVVIDEKLLVTVFSKGNYDDGAKEIMEVLNKHGK